MSHRNAESIEALLNNANILDATSSLSEETRRRKAFKPYVCPVFSGAYAQILPSNEFSFEVDPEARRQLPAIIGNQVLKVSAGSDPDASFQSDYSRPRRIGIVFSGGPAPGGHNVIAGLYDAAKKANPESRIFGFLIGPDGIMEGEYLELNDRLVDDYRNLGGFTMIKTGRAKIDTPRKMELSRATILDLKLDALVVVGGDDSNTNAAFLAQELFKDKVQIIGVPKTIDGDIQVRDATGKVLCAMSFGFHSAARAFSKSISNLSNDCSSDIKYWHICRVMGRVASHLALEVALQTHANMTLIGEDLADYVDKERLEKAEEAGTTDYTAYGMTLRHLSRVICHAIVRRAAMGKNYGIIVIPEGILEFINEIEVFIIKLNTIIGEYNATHDKDFHSRFPSLRDKLDYLNNLVHDKPPRLPPNLWNPRDDDLFNDLPAFFQEGLMTERDSHGNFQFSQMPTEKVLLDMVKDYLAILRDQGRYKIGIHQAYYVKTMKKAGLAPDYYGPVLFNNYENEEFLMVKDSIISFRTLKSALERGGILHADDKIPPAVEKIYKMSVPSFKTQSHFYGYDGRGSDPTRFDCNYTYNLGLTAFCLIANGATGQMAAIRNLEYGYEHWEPMGLPIAPLMRLEERKGKLTLVLEKSLVDLHSTAFRVVKAFRERWLAACAGEDQFRRPAPIHLDSPDEEQGPIALRLNALGTPRER